MDPLELFKEWYLEEKTLSGAALPGACCLTTLGLDNFPNSRFVSLKEIKNGAFIITGLTDSRKGQEIAVDNKVALAFWWPCSAKQVRVQGVAVPIDPEEAAVYFAERDTAAQLVSVISRQGAPLGDYDKMHEALREALAAGKHRQVARPEGWGGYAITPARIELMRFSETRLHHRNLYEQKDGQWVQQQLQP
ncbi:pyridoxine/pyridoxamine 5'-phosphate oxidase [Niabella beijingensis]|uniref:pyridoxine/pyridoxamine 5'-phosphate oxidase n=1 Tax=Niabella beijingensis TaxID=2872700 RepID=UPI001CBF761A|nr:pyridoxal 5'-phosphate synthase [Niabella beijingensis]MBZ4191086.1 pyridoxal 5'-phosphate synthase [Niabella beijingensis]